MPSDSSIVDTGNSSSVKMYPEVEMKDGDLGWWKRAVTIPDGTWQTRGWHSTKPSAQNAQVERALAMKCGSSALLKLNCYHTCALYTEGIRKVSPFRVYKWPTTVCS